MVSTQMVLAMMAISGALGQSTSTAPLLTVSTSAPPSAGSPVLGSFLSYSIEHYFFPDYAGNSSEPNHFSYNLLNVIGNLTGTLPVIRVGGNTQDFALYDPDLPQARSGIYSNPTADYPDVISIGSVYFDSFNTWPGVQYTYGFDFAIDNITGADTLTATAPLACKALEGGKLAAWEMGNEPDLYGSRRPSDWAEPQYIAQWRANTSTVKQAVSQACPGQPFGWYAPSLAGPNNHLNPVVLFEDGLSQEGDIPFITIHNYMGGATEPGVSLQGTLMNHTNIEHVVAAQTNASHLLAPYDIPFILGETNSLYGEGAPGVSNTFGAALWSFDFSLWCASQGIGRLHMHQGTDYRYASWQPIETSKTSIGTKAPFYGNVATAAAIGNLTQGNVSVANLPFEPSSETDAAYAIYKDGVLQRVAVVNMMEYNSSDTSDNVRGAVSYSFNVTDISPYSSIPIQRLSANGSDAITGITWDGWSYNYELANGQPQRLDNVTRGENATLHGCIISVTVPHSQVAVLSFV